MADISKEDLRKEIAAVLKNADLLTITAKKVRQELEEKLDANLQSRKKEIDELVMEFANSKKDKDKKKGGKKADSEDEEEDEEEEEEEEEEAEDSEDDKKKKRASTGKKPAAKKAKKGSDESDASEQSEGDSEEEYSPNNSPKKASKPIKTRKLPPKKKKGSESDSDEDWSKAKPAGRKAGGAAGGGKRGGSGYTKTMKLSPELAAFVGQDSMARHEVVRKVWAIIKERDMYDPKNKQYAICDDALFKVIGVKRFRTFGMMKYLKHHFVS